MTVTILIIVSSSHILGISLNSLLYTLHAASPASEAGSRPRSRHRRARAQDQAVIFPDDAQHFGLAVQRVNIVESADDFARALAEGNQLRHGRTLEHFCLAPGCCDGGQAEKSNGAKGLENE